jgi:hypothetical protein
MTAKDGDQDMSQPSETVDSNANDSPSSMGNTLGHSMFPPNGNVVTGKISYDTSSSQIGASEGIMVNNEAELVV